ncbi:MAG: hypothetical protein AAFY76_15615 [Cyanobacteria bacterium J06649_11]
MEKVQKALIRLSGGLMLLMAFMMMGFQAEAQTYVGEEEALNRLTQAAEQVKESDYNWTAPTSNGIALFPPHMLEKVYLEAVQVKIKSSSDVSQGMTEGHQAYLDRFPSQTNWASQWRLEVDQLLQD